MDDSLGNFKSLLENDKALDDTLSFESSSEEEECSHSDNNIDEEAEVEHDGGLASIADAIEVNKSLEVNGEFVNNPMSFNADKSWLATYKIADMLNESQFTTQGPTNANGDWKGLMFSDKKSLSRALEEWHVTHFVQMKVKKSDTCCYTCVCVENNCSWRLHAHKPKGAAYFLVSQYNGSHNCVIAIGNSMHRNCTSALICEKILLSMRASLSMSVKKFNSR